MGGMGGGWMEDVEARWMGDGNKLLTILFGVDTMSRNIHLRIDPHICFHRS